MYQLMKNPQGVVCAVNQTINGIQYSIPFAEDNTDYQAYLKWLAEGNQPIPADGDQ
jgi:hypothetical protein